MAQLAQHPARPARGNGCAYEAIHRMGAATHAQVVRAKRVFASRDAGLADDLLREDADLKRLGYLDDTKFATAKALSAAERKHHGRRRAMISRCCITVSR